MLNMCGIYCSKQCNVEHVSNNHIVYGTHHRQYAKFFWYYYANMLLIVNIYSHIK